MKERKIRNLRYGTIEVPTLLPCLYVSYVSPNQGSKSRAPKKVEEKETPRGLGFICYHYINKYYWLNRLDGLWCLGGHVTGVGGRHRS